MPRLRLLAAQLAVLVAATACGSTAELPAGSVELGAGSSDGLSTGLDVPQPGLEGGADAGPAPTTGGPSVDGPAATAGPVTPTKGGAVAPTGPVTIPTTGRGWDKDFVYIGVTTQKDVQSVAETIGANGLDGGDQEAQANAVAAELNRRGGLFGRQIKLVFRDHGTLATESDPNTVANATCTYYTQDRPVMAVISPVTLLDVPSLRSCFARWKVPLISATMTAVDNKVGAALAPYFYQAVSPTWDALAPVLVSRLTAQGWFTGWNVATGSPGPAKVKVGLLVEDSDIGSRVAGLLKAALSSAGYKDTIVYQYDPKQNDQSSAVLQFNGNGVTHMIVADPEIIAFQIAANSQNYRPRYGISTLNAPHTFLEQNSPPGQNNGAMGVGWSPSLDVNDSNDPGTTGPAEKECRDLLARGGQTFARKRLAEAVAFAICDGMRLVADAAKAGGGLTGPAIFRGAMIVAPTFRTALSFASGLGQGRLFLPGAVRDIQWVTSCSCIQYKTKNNHPLR